MTHTSLFGKGRHSPSCVRCSLTSGLTNKKQEAERNCHNNVTTNNAKEPDMSTVKQYPACFQHGFLHLQITSDLTSDEWGVLCRTACYPLARTSQRTAPRSKKGKSRKPMKRRGHLTNMRQNRIKGRGSALNVLPASWFCVY